MVEFLEFVGCKAGWIFTEECRKEKVRLCCYLCLEDLPPPVHLTPIYSNAQRPFDFVCFLPSLPNARKIGYPDSCRTESRTWALDC
jgi:hypothetical protein